MYLQYSPFINNIKTKSNKKSFFIEKFQEETNNLISNNDNLINKLRNIIIDNGSSDQKYEIETTYNDNYLNYKNSKNDYETNSTEGNRMNYNKNFNEYIDKLNIIFYNYASYNLNNFKIDFIENNYIIEISNVNKIIHNNHDIMDIYNKNDKIDSTINEIIINIRKKFEKIMLNIMNYSTLLNDNYNNLKNYKYSDSLFNKENNEDTDTYLNKLNEIKGYLDNIDSYINIINQEFIF